MACRIAAMRCRRSLAVPSCRRRALNLSRFKPVSSHGIPRLFLHHLSGCNDPGVRASPGPLGLRTLHVELGISSRDASPARRTPVPVPPEPVPSSNLLNSESAAPSFFSRPLRKEGGVFDVPVPNRLPHLSFRVLCEKRVGFLTCLYQIGCPILLFASFAKRGWGFEVPYRIGCPILLFASFAKRGWGF